jgi:hypothetical protein
MGRRKNATAQLVTCIGFAALLAFTGCSAPQLPKGVIGRIAKYDYSPSVIQTGEVRQFWWCGSARNPDKQSQDSDAIIYESVNLATGETVGPLTVLAETPGGWDSQYTCNPKVIEGTFSNPLGDGQNYTYALYYVGVSYVSNNNIGVAFSNDGIAWKKYPKPVISAASPNGYGVGQPALFNKDRKSAITMFYEDDDSGIHHVEATSTDGIHFTTQGPLSSSGLDPRCPGTWGDMAYDSKTGYWYALFDREFRDPKTTGGVIERGQLGVELYRISESDLLKKDAPWEQITTVDTNLTGYESNFIGGFVRDPFGTLNVASYPAIQMYVSVSDPQSGWDDSPKTAADSAKYSTWDIAPAEWVPGKAMKALNRYFNNDSYVVTTGWANASDGFQRQLTLGHVFENPQLGATMALYNCKNGEKDYFVSRDGGCAGKRILGRNGFAYALPVPGKNLVALYSCEHGNVHFVSQDPKCEGKKIQGVLGYVLP